MRVDQVLILNYLLWSKQLFPFEIAEYAAPEPREQTQPAPTDPVTSVLTCTEGHAAEEVSCHVWSKMLSSFPSHCTKISALPHSPCLGDFLALLASGSCPALCFSCVPLGRAAAPWNTLTSWLWEQSQTPERQKCSVLLWEPLCLETLPLGNWTDQWIPLQMDCSPFCHHSHSCFSVMQNLQLLLLPVLNADGWLSLLLSVLGMDQSRNSRNWNLFRSLSVSEIFLCDSAWGHLTVTQNLICISILSAVLLIVAGFEQEEPTWVLMTIEKQS